MIVKGHVPIPGTKRVKYVEQNTAAADIKLSVDDLSIIPLGTSTGARYNEAGMAWIDK
ncbi:hypothetical protein [Fibrisoma montanum]|uniref:hypothetical protein n=1 Tax=Fibrisoma montanum TaxID=2305895 RepID=UPI0021D2715F|nr:hypothetical protein [Fibrisoma montanum]